MVGALGSTAGAIASPRFLPQLGNDQLCLILYMVTIYLARMAITKTTVYLDAAEYRRLKALASKEGRSAAELIRDAVSEYTRRKAPRVLPTSLGVGRSGDESLAERSEELLKGMGEDL